MAHVLILSPPNVLLRVFYGIDLAVGAHRPNRPDDVKLVQFFLRSLSRINDVVTRESYFPSGQALLEADGFYGPQTAAYIKHFEAVLSRAAPGGGPMKPWQDGVIDPKPPGLSFGPVHHRAYAIIRLNTLYAEAFGIDRHNAIDKDLDFPATLRPKLFV
jgi:peptidoglycan hydrolase-like protein with peptidoglycan-binding domain